MPSAPNCPMPHRPSDAVATSPDTVTSPVVEGEAFSGSAKLQAGALIVCLVYFAIRVADKVAWAELPLTAWVFLLVWMAALLFTYFWIWVSRTSVDAITIRQSWFWKKSVRIADISDVKFVCVPHLEWLIAPRIVVKVSGRGSYTFYAADREVIRSFAKLSLGMGA